MRAKEAAPGGGETTTFHFLRASRQTDWELSLAESGQATRKPHFMASRVAHILLIIASYTDRGGFAFPSVKTLSAETFIERHVVGWAIRFLVDLGVLTPESRGRCIGWQIDLGRLRRLPQIDYEATARRTRRPTLAELGLEPSAERAKPGAQAVSGLLAGTVHRRPRFADPAMRGSTPF